MSERVREEMVEALAMMLYTADRPSQLAEIAAKFGVRFDMMNQYSSALRIVRALAARPASAEPVCECGHPYDDHDYMRHAEHPTCAVPGCGCCSYPSGAGARPVEPVVDLLRMNSAVNVGRAMFNARIAAGMTQADVARISGTTQAHVSMVEAAERNATLDVLSRMARAVGMVVTLAPVNTTPAATVPDAGVGEE